MRGSLTLDSLGPASFKLTYVKTQSPAESLTAAANPADEYLKRGLRSIEIFRIRSCSRRSRAAQHFRMIKVNRRDIKDPRRHQ
jgi:hypothetical protein